MAKKVFEQPFIGTSVEGDFTLLYSNDGSYSVVLQIENPALQYCADETIYEACHHLYGHIIKILGANHILQKTDIIVNRSFTPPVTNSPDYLDQKNFQHFAGRNYNDLLTYLTITKPNEKGKLFSYNAAEVKTFCDKAAKVMDILSSNKLSVSTLNERELKALHSRYIAFNFKDDVFTLDNIQSGKTGLTIGGKSLKITSLIDIDELNLPNSVSTYATRTDIGKSFPTDTFSFLLNVPAADTILYNQVIIIPDQLKVKGELEVKMKRHTSMPDPANNISVQDIEAMFLDVAKDNELLVYCHYSLLTLTDSEQQSKASNYIETQLFALGIIPGKNSYNQLELFRSAIPGNAGELQHYDTFLTSRPAALCFLFKERLPKTEDSDYLLWFTDRQGIPVGIDTSEKIMQQGRVSNRNKFVLGPSGTGKSFTMNRYLSQCHKLGADIVLVDTGHSYYGTCKYFNGKYITYSEDKPITMNPFRIEPIENNEEKRQILKSLIGLIWKGTEGTLSQVEDTVLSGAIKGYYSDYFSDKGNVPELNFNAFYEYAIDYINDLKRHQDIRFDLAEFQFVLKKFYRGGEYDKILNDDFDRTLFNESFIVFEIDSIKEHKLLFPITTLIIMDVFLQKMRHRKNKKILVIEEAWKAIASPMMAGYILYLYKTVRKFNGEAIVVTQELGDIIGNAIVKDSIIANSDTLLLLDQSRFRDNFESVAKLLSLNEVEQRKIFTINKLDNKDGRSRFKEVYIKRGATGEVYGIELPLEEYLTYTTEWMERKALEFYLEQYESYEQAIEAMVSDYKESGLKLPQFIQQINKKALQAV